MTDLCLENRSGLPPELRALADEIPRLTWENHPEFRGLASFWLEKHLEFRTLTDLLIRDAEARLDSRLDSADHAVRISQFGSALVQSLQGHHQIEDAHYFPHMMQIAPRVAPGFELLDADHHALDAIIADFVGAANAVIGQEIAAEGPFLDALVRFRGLMVRHLEDEEDLVIPVILSTGLR